MNAENIATVKAEIVVELKGGIRLNTGIGKRSNTLPPLELFFRIRVLRSARRCRDNEDDDDNEDLPLVRCFLGEDRSFIVFIVFVDEIV